MLVCKVKRKLGEGISYYVAIKRGRFFVWFMQMWQSKESPLPYGNPIPTLEHVYNGLYVTDADVFVCESAPYNQSLT